MKLSKKSIAYTLAGAMGLTALAAQSFGHGEKSCQHGYSGTGHTTMMSPHGPMSKNPEKMIEMMSHKLGLSDEQRDLAFAKLDEFTPKIRQYRQEIKQGMKRLHEIDVNADDFESELQTLADEQGQRMADMLVLGATLYTELAQLLTDEQKSELEKMRQKRGKRWHTDQTQS